MNPAVDDVRTRILREATRQFAAKGYEGTSIQQIAQSVGITRPTLVYHFGSKDALRREVLEQLLAHWKDDLPRVLQAATTGSDRFRNATGALLSFFHDDPDRARLLTREILDRPEEMKDLFAEHLQPWTALITDYIRRGQQEVASGSTRTPSPTCSCSSTPSSPPSPPADPRDTSSAIRRVSTSSSTS